MEKTKRQKSRPTGKGTLVGVHLQPSDLKALDFWIRQQGVHQSRPEAIRNLIGIAFAVMKVDRAITTHKSPLAVELAALKIHQLLKPDEFPEMKVERLMKAG